MKVYALYNPKGGVGKTSSAVNFAWLSAQGGARTLLWDLDPQAATSYSLRVRARVDGGAQGLLKDPSLVGRAIRATDYERLDVLPADYDYREFDLVLGRESVGRQAIQRLLEPLAASYDRILIDCAPGLSLVSEHVFRAVDALLVPTVPTVLSLRTLSRLLKHLKTEPRDARPSVVPFFTMADRRKSLHRQVMEYAEAERLGFAAGVVPYASVVEQMGVRRQPLHLFAPSSPAAQAYSGLWDELVSRLESSSNAERTGDLPKRKAIKSLLREAEDSAPARKPARKPVRRAPKRPKKVERETAASTPKEKKSVVQDEGRKAQPPAAGERGVEREFKLVLASGREADLIVSALVPSGPVPARSVSQVNHFFDDAGGSLRKARLALRLREQGEEYFLTAKGPHAGSAEGAEAEPSGLSSMREVEARVSADEAAEVLAEERSPLELLARAVSGSQLATDDLLATMRSSFSGKLLRVGTFRNTRRRVGPLHLAGTRSDLELVFELDRTEFPGGHVHHELELEVDAADVAECEVALRALLERVGLPWVPARSKAVRMFEILASR